jgi:hypothetical protein
MPGPTSRQARAAGSALMVLPPAPGPAGAEVIATRAASLALADIHAHQLGRHTVDRNRFFGQPPLQAKQTWQSQHGHLIARTGRIARSTAHEQPGCLAVWTTHESCLIRDRLKPPESVSAQSVPTVT